VTYSSEKPRVASEVNYNDSSISNNLCRDGCNSSGNCELRLGASDSHTTRAQQNTGARARFPVQDVKLSCCHCWSDKRCRTHPPGNSTPSLAPRTAVLHVIQLSLMTNACMRSMVRPKSVLDLAPQMEFDAIIDVPHIPATTDRFKGWG